MKLTEEQKKIMSRPDYPELEKATHKIIFLSVLMVILIILLGISLFLRNLYLILGIFLGIFLISYLLKEPLSVMWKKPNES